MQLVQLRSPRNTHSSIATSPKFEHLAVELLATDAGHYAFDARNVEFIEVDEVAYEILRILRQAPLDMEEVIRRLPRFDRDTVVAAWREIEGVQRQGFLVPSDFERVVAHADADFEGVLTTQMAGMTVFLTTDCNLACSYCIFGGQYDRHPTLSKVDMSWDTLRNAMDFLAANSSEQEEVRVDFFGGEPMMAFDMLVRAVEHLKSVVEGKRVVATIATNGTILTRRMLDVLIEHDIYLQISIDGARALHDRNRRFKASKRGSFDVVMRNIQRIRDTNVDYFRDKLRLKSVLTVNDVDPDCREFLAHPCIKELAELGNLSFLAEEPHYDLEKDDAHFERLERLAATLREMHDVATLEDIEARLSLTDRQLFRRSFADFFEVQVLNKLYLDGESKIPFRKGCMIGYAEGAVTPGGDIAVCHKAAGKNFSIGNVNEGRWHFDRIRELKQLLMRHGRGCSGCFAQRFCNLCYEKIDGECGALDASLQSYCEFTRQHYRAVFSCMLGVLEQNPGLWSEAERLIDRTIEARRAA